MASYRAHMQSIAKLLSLSMCIMSCGVARSYDRTPLDKWERQQFEKTGIALELPRHPLNLYRRYQVRETMWPNDLIEGGFPATTLEVQMHPMWTSRFIEPEFRLRLSFSIYSESSFQKTIASWKEIENHPYREIDVGRDVLFSGVQQVGDKKHTAAGFERTKYNFVRAYKMPSNESLLGRAFLYTDGRSIADDQADFAAIERILNSVQFLDGAGAKNGRD